ncbi:hypothetical protein D6D13_07573 [Aureobasidium pullulans]|uniref:F-box domain-containing protein n=1 Tax=Aureobasidium pullulans TaxID=5580 RepID=A0A4S9CA00_AURPU|nr:hypothetical protein D6D13_07573 [Aureobasidium pullulans]
MKTCQRFTAPARDVCWKQSQMRNYMALLNMNGRPDFGYARMIRSQELVFGPGGPDPSAMRMPLPLLEHLSIRHDQLHVQVNPVVVSGFITPRLKSLEVRHGRTDNFIPALAQAQQLTQLLIHEGVEVVGGDPQAFGDLVRLMPSLTHVSTGSLSSGRVFIALARCPFMEQLSMYSYTDVDIHDTLQALEAPQAFSHLKSLYITMQASAAAILLPLLSRLEALTIHINSVLTGGEDHGQIIPEIFNALQDKSLVRLNISFAMEVQTNVTAEILDHVLPVSSPIESLVIWYFGHDLDVEALTHVGSRYPRLRELDLLGEFDLDQLPLNNDNSNGPLFPALQNLSLTQTSQILIEETADAQVRSWVDKLFAIAPNLQFFESVEGSLHPSVKMRFLRQTNGMTNCFWSHRWSIDQS